jgi:hypothetical protein
MIGGGDDINAFRFSTAVALSPNRPCKALPAAVPTGFQRARLVEPFTSRRQAAAVVARPVAFQPPLLNPPIVLPKIVCRNLFETSLF